MTYLEKRELHQKLLSGVSFKITLKKGDLGCSDLQDACKNEGYLVLSYSNGSFMIDTPMDSEGFENLACVDDFNYIETILGTYTEM